MATEVIVPPLSQTMDTVVLVEWLKAAGDEVVKGEPLFVVETDKANLEVEAPATGVLGQVLAQAGQEVKVRSVIGLIGAAGEAPAEGEAPQGKAGQMAVPEVAAATVHALAGAKGPGGQPLPEERQRRIFASPRARALAQREGVDLSDVPASGPQHMIVERDVRACLEAHAAARPVALPVATPVARRVAQAARLDLGAVTPARPGGRITRADVQAALEQQGSPDGVQWVAMEPIRRTIARRMVQSQQAAAEVTLMREVDATELVELRQRILAELAEGDPRPTYTDLLVSIVARQLRKHPNANATTDGERIGLYQRIHVALAVDTEGGLLTPVLRDADRKGLLQLAQERTELVKRAADGTLGLEELSGGTFTLTNMGTLGVDAFTPIINPPQTAILGVGRIRPAPAVYEGALCIRQMLFLSLTFDHRVIDGGPAARFLNDVVRLIERPHLMWL